MATIEGENGGIESIDEKIIEEINVINQEIEEAENEIAKQKIKTFKPIYEKRNKVFKKIPKFWPQVLTKSVVASYFSNNDDYSLIQCIDDITIERDENSLESFKIIFSFSENSYFKNKELIKEFIDADGQHKIKSTPIEWIDDRDYTKKRKVDEDEDDQSFIKWFSEETAEESWEVGKAFKEDVYPHAWTIYVTDYDDIPDDEDDNQDFEEESEEEELEEPSKKRVKHN